ncbi:MAG TPA: polysaccharide deacetylase family protein [Stellaceae bacterium]|nr:polysaccharide deacetylase family protein [Stellaceae bacterium]
MKYFERSPFVPITERPKLTWPNNARLAVWITNNVEYFREDSTAGVGLTTARPAQVPDIANHTWRDYGPRVGFWRLAQILKELELPASVALNAQACVHYPQVVKACVEMGWELVGHGLTNSEHLTGKSEADERAIILATLSTIESFSGKRPLGWLGPAAAESLQTLDILAELGVRYVADWLNDEQPSRLNTIHGPIGSVPTSTEINDLIGVVARHYTAPELAQVMVDQFDELYETFDGNGRMMCIVLHPFFSGAPFRARHLRKALAHMRSRKEVWFATAGQIWAHYEASFPA